MSRMVNWFRAVCLSGLAAAQVLSAANVYLSDLKESSVTGLFTKYWPSLSKDFAWTGQNGEGKTGIKIAGTTFKKGLGLHPNANGEAIVTYNVAKQYTTLVLYPGISDNVEDNWFEWCKFYPDGRAIGLQRPADGFNGAETNELVRLGSGASAYVTGDGKRIGEVMHFIGPTKAVQYKFNITGVTTLQIHASAWGTEPCNRPYHKNGTYPGCPRWLGSSYGDQILFGDAMVSAGATVAQTPRAKSVTTANSSAFGQPARLYAINGTLVNSKARLTNALVIKSAEFGRISLELSKR